MIEEGRKGGSSTGSPLPVIPHGITVEIVHDPGYVSTDDWTRRSALSVRALLGLAQGLPLTIAQQ